MGSAGKMAGGVLGAAGAIQKGKATEQAAEYQEQVAKNNQIIAESLAKDATERGRIAEKKHRVGIEGFKGSQRVALAKSGVVVDQDTALSLLLDTAQFGEESAQNVRGNAEREAFGFRAQGAGFAADAAMAKAQGEAAVRASRFEAGASILGAF